MNPSDAELRAVLTSCKCIAIVGHSDQPARDSYQISQYLRQAGYTVYAVNPYIRTAFGEPAHPDLRSLPEPVDIVNVFRRSEALPDVVAQAIAIRARVVWAQLGVRHAQAAERARQAGVLMVMDRCIKVEHLRLGIPRRT